MGVKPTKVARISEAELVRKPNLKLPV